METKSRYIVPRVICVEKTNDSIRFCEVIKKGEKRHNLGCLPSQGQGMDVDLEKVR